MRYRPGQTLIELLIAVTVISTGLFAAATIVFSNLQLSTRDADEVVAVNLAREGIEQAKALRDANWLAGNPFNQGFSDQGTDYTAVPTWSGDPTANAISFDFTPSVMKEDLAQVRQSTSLSTPGFFTQSDLSAPLTRWRRLLVFHPICVNPSGGLEIVDDGQTCAFPPTIGIRVEVRIAWQQKGQSFERIFYEDLFDWR